MFQEKQLENELINGENNMYNHQIDQLSKKELVEYIHEINRQFDEYRAEQEQRIAELERERDGALDKCDALFELAQNLGACPEYLKVNFCNDELSLILARRDLEQQIKGAKGFSVYLSLLGFAGVNESFKEVESELRQQAKEQNND